jgi:hypothetical protein
LPSSFQLILDGTAAAEALYGAITALEVEENADLPGAVQITLAVNRSADSDLAYVNDPGFQPFKSLAIVATPDGGDPQCIFDGVVLSQKLHLERGATGSTLLVWGQDASWLMNLEEKVKEWTDVTDADVASSIFGDYGITASDDNSNDDSASHTEDTHSLMQRATDGQFLRELARRSGKWFRVYCEGQAGQRKGLFARPKVDGEAAVKIDLGDPESWNVDKLDFAWDVAARPTKVQARTATFDDDSEDGAGGETSSSGLAPLDARGLSDFAGRDTTALLTAPADDAGALDLRASGLLGEAGWFARCEGEADVTRLKAVLRVGQIVDVAGAGAVSSGKYLVFSVRHTIAVDSHKMKFVLVRNAVGAAPAGGGGGLGL